jgi:hypothetical protein
MVLTPRDRLSAPLQPALTSRVAWARVGRPVTLHAKSLDARVPNSSGLPAALTAGMVEPHACAIALGGVGPQFALRATVVIDGSKEARRRRLLRGQRWTSVPFPTGR